MFEVVSATRLTHDQFWSEAPLGTSVQRTKADERVSFHIAFENTRGLSEIYNERIDNSSATALLFVHDDVWIEDAFFVDRVFEGLKLFDIIGLAGNRQRYPFQKTWFRSPILKGADVEHTSGMMGHGDKPFGELRAFGPVPARCALLDGVLMAARRQALIDAKVRFDPRFAFHFYDLDFSRAATAAGLTLGTWPISVTHRSQGAYQTPAWQDAMAVYFSKWGD
jgi:GT2 family glycosyltransferase